MSEREAMPRRRYVELPPEPGGFEEAIARGRRRRRRTAGTSAVASISAVLLAISLTGSSPDTDARLEFTRPPDPQVSAEDAAAEAANPAELADPAQAEQSDGDAAAGRSAGLGRRDADADATVATAARPRSPDRSAAAAQTRRLEPPEEQSGQDLGTCNNLSVSQQWCLLAARTVMGQEDEANLDSTLSITVCLARVATARRALSFRSEQQVDFVIRKKGSEEILWQWAHRAAFDEQPTRDEVGPGECRTYSVRWLGQLDNNEHLINESGTYVLTATSLARELGTSNFATATFELTS